MRFNYMSFLMMWFWVFLIVRNEPPMWIGIYILIGTVIKALETMQTNGKLVI